MIAAEVDRNVRWVLTVAAKTPRVAILEASANRVESGEVIRINIDARVANVGWMATATAHAAESLEIARPVRAYLELDNATVQGQESIVDLGVLPGTHGGRPDIKEVSWTVRIADGARPVHVIVVVSSEKAGTAPHVVRVPPKARSPDVVGFRRRISLVTKHGYGLDADVRIHQGVLLLGRRCGHSVLSSGAYGA